MSERNDIMAYVLAGGKSSRMGQDKGLMMFRGKPMIQFVLDELSKLHLEVKIIANSDAYNALGYEVIKDIVAEKGPMGGILTALNDCQTAYALVLSCDTPLLPAAIIKHLISAMNDDITVAQTSTQIHPLCAIYKTTLKQKIKQHIENTQLKMQELIGEVRSKAVNMDTFMEQYAEAFVNMNTPKDVELFK